jgi:biotin synthase
VSRTVFAAEDIRALLSRPGAADAEHIRQAAMRILEEEIGTKVYYRGLVEFSNICARDCFYCGIRLHNEHVKRYTLSEEQILQAARWCAEQGYGSFVLQSGERTDREFIDFVTDVVRAIKRDTVSDRLPEGLGITLCVGEHTRETYRRFFDAGAHRYLLRIETTSPELFAKIHPPEQRLESRIACLESLEDIGYQVGTGVMIGIPGQSIEDLAADIAFFRDHDIDMIGMGPYIVHEQTPMAAHADEVESRHEEIFALALRMIAATRIVLRDVNIAATTALQAMKADGREQGLLHGANVIMPQLTPTEYREEYLLYEGKPCLDENASMCRRCLEGRIASTGREIAYDEWGDSVHFARRRGNQLERSGG